MGNTTAVISATVDASGDATAETESLNGLLMGIRVDFASAQGDMTITEANGLQRTLLDVDTVSGTKNFYNPQNEIQSSDGTALGIYSPYLLQSNRLTITIANGTEDDTVTVWLEVLGS